MSKVRTLIVSASIAALLLASTASMVEANKKICPRINQNFCQPLPRPLPQPMDDPIIIEPQN